MSNFENKILLNADLGEGCDNDKAIMPFIDIANIACGGHAGDAETIKTTINQAKRHSVMIGAHPSYADKENFGRKVIPLSRKEFTQSINSQLSFIANISEQLNYPLSHIKPHGALYNQLADQTGLSNLFIHICKNFNPELIIIGLANSELTRSAKNLGMAVFEEGFIDRRYLNSGRLAPRSANNAVIHNTAEAYAQAKKILTQRKVTAIDGKDISLIVDTLCLHGDNANSLALSRRVSSLFNLKPA